MIKYLVSIVLLILWAMFLDRAFPSDHENSNTYTIIVFFVLICWLIAGVFNLILKYKSPSILVFAVLVLVSCTIIYNFFPWHKGYSAIELIKDYKTKKKNTQEVEISWIYKLDQRVENYPLIDLAQRKFINEVKPDKCYLFQCFYCDNEGVNQYVARYMIYIKDSIPYTTNPAIAFTSKGRGSYELTVDNETSMQIEVQNNIAKIGLRNDRLHPANNSENHYLIMGKYRFTLDLTDPNNGFNVRKAYWIYNFL